MKRMLLFIVCVLGLITSSAMVTMTYAPALQAAPGQSAFEQQSLEREKVTQLKRIADALEKIAARK